MKGITLKQIAYDLKVSPSTVSRALADNYQIGADTKKRIIDYARQNNYVANRFAQGLRIGKTKTIGIVLPNLNSAFAAQMLSGVTASCQQSGYHLVFMQSNEVFEDECKCISSLQASGADGLLIAPSISTNDFSHLLQSQKEGFPIVILDRISDELPISSVGLENQVTSYEMTKQLIRNGYRRIAVVNFKPSVLFARERLKGYLIALEEEGIPYDNNLVKFLNNSNAQSSAIMEDFIGQYLFNEHRADAIIGMTDTLTLKVLEIVAKLKVNLKIAGFCNDNFAKLAYPDAEIVSQPAYDLGRLAVKKLLGKIEDVNFVKQFEMIRLSCNLNDNLSQMQLAE